MHLKLLLVFLICAFDADSQTVKAEFFGMHNADFSKQAEGIRFATIRLWDCGVCWNQLETSPGNWNFDQFDRLVSYAVNNKIELVYVLGQTPGWATSDLLDSTGVYGIGANHVPKTIELWENYVRTVASRYIGKIQYYEVWNEPNFPIFFNGSVEQMSELTRSAGKLLKSIDPNIQVISPGIIAGTFDWLPKSNSGANWLQTYLSLTPAACIDIIGAHFYTPEKASPEQELIPLTKSFKQVLQRFNIDKPVWNTEQGYGAMDPAKRVNYQGDTAVGVAVRTYLINLMEGIDRVYWYNWSNREFCSLYLVEEDRITPTEAARAIALTREWMVGKTISGTECIDQSTYMLHLTDELNRKFTIVWSDVHKQIKHLNYREIKSIQAVNSKAVRNSRNGFSINQLPVLVSFK
jgi:hypothetical protein